MTRRLVSQIATRALQRSGYICHSCLTRARSIQDGPRDAALLTTITAPGRRLSSSARAHHPSRSRYSSAVAARQDPQYHQHRRASNISLSSNSAINAPSNVPAKFREIHDALARLQDDAAAYADLSRLQLALRSFEKEQPVLRIGFLSLGARGATAARALVRLLLSDLLGSTQSWEQELVDTSKDDGRGTLIRYGQLGDIAPSNALLKTILVDSVILKDHHLEFLITPMLTQFMQDQATPEDIEDALLVPSLTIPASAGRVGFVRNPVHKAIVVAAGIDGAVQLGKVQIPQDKSLFSAVVDVDAKQELNSGVKIVDVAKGTRALNSFRQDTSSTTFAGLWAESGIQDMISWLAADGAPSNSSVVLDYTSRTVAVIEQAIERAALADISNLQSSSISEDRRTELQAAITQWSADAHGDLRNNLMTAVESKAWRRTAWFRLLWRIDDVSYSCTDILNQCWLNETEQRLAFLSGRVLQAGLASETELKENVNVKQLVHPAIQEQLDSPPQRDVTTVEMVQIPTMLSRVHEQSGINPLFDPPWPQTINLARQLMLHTDVPSLHRKAQSLVLSTLTTIGGASALSAWLWVATSGVALYECGAIASLGLVWSLRRLQKLWGKDRDAFATKVQENGRRVLIEIENQLRRLVNEGGRPAAAAAAASVDAESSARAKQAVLKCREALAKLAA